MPERTRVPVLLAAIGLAAAALAPTAGVSAVDSGGGRGAGDHRAAQAGGGWTKVSTGPVDTLSEITLQRTADGLLHSVYSQDVGSSYSYEHSTLSTSGSVTGHSNVLGTWSALVDNPKLLATASGGLRLVFSGLQDADSTNFYSHGYAYDTVSDSSGAAWAVQPHALTKFGGVYSGYGVGATTLSNGTPVTAGTLNSDISYRVGDIATTDQNVVTNATADTVYTSASCCLYDTQLVNSGDAVWMAWYANGSSEATNGTFVQQVYPAAGPVLKAPGSSNGTDSLSADQTIAMVARPGGGVVLAYKMGYPTTTSIGLWQVGAPKAVKVPGSKGADRVALSTGVTGRMWLAWSTDGSRAYALRTSPTGFRLGAVQSLAAPTRSSAMWSIAVDASLNQGTVVVNDTTSQSIYSVLVNPGLSLKAKPGKVTVGKAAQVTVTTTDAGAGIAGVKVKGGGDSCTTKASGKCTLSIKAGKPGKVSVKATKNGYGAAKVTITAKK